MQKGKNMKQAIATFAAMCVAALLVGCATQGRATYDDSKVARIQKDVTTEAELVQWFGPPSARTLSRDGNKSLLWRFPSGHLGSHAGSLSVNLDSSGKVVTYNASEGK